MDLQKPGKAAHVLKSLSLSQGAGTWGQWLFHVNRTSLRRSARVLSRGTVAALLLVPSIPAVAAIQLAVCCRESACWACDCTFFCCVTDGAVSLSSSQHPWRSLQEENPLETKSLDKWHQQHKPHLLLHLCRCSFSVMFSFQTVFKR